MSIAPFYDRVMETTTTTGTGTLTLAGAAAGFQTFAAVGNGNTTPMAIWEVDADGNPSGAWEVASACTYTASGTTLTRGTFRASSTGSAVSFGAGTKRVAQVLPAFLLNSMVAVSRGYIQGLESSATTDTAVVIATGELNINGTIRTYAGATLTSGSTMKDMANGTVTIGASKCYYLFAYNNAGTLEIRIEENDGTGDGAAPVFTTAVDYWAAASTGVEARRIGKFWTDGSSHVIPFRTVDKGRLRKMVCNNDTGVTVATGLTSTTFTQSGFTVTPFVTADDEETIWVIGYQHTSTGTAYIIVSFDGASETLFSRNGNSTTSPSYASALYGKTGTTPYYLVGASNAGQAFLSGSVYFV